VYNLPVQQNRLATTGLLQPLSMSLMVWTDIGIDFIEGLPKVNGRSVILTVIDRFSKSAHFLPLGHLYTVTTVARVFFNNIIKLHGVPRLIISDRDPAFTGRFGQELFKLAGVNLQFLSAFSPTVRRVVGGDEQDHHHVPLLPHR
jgi:hypothetical protein